MDLNEIYATVAEELNIPVEVVSLAYRSYWEFIKSKIEELPLKEELSEEEFKELRTNFNLPSLGKLYITYETFQRMKRRFQYLEKLRENVQDKESTG